MPHNLNNKSEGIDFIGAVLFGASVIFLFYSLVTGETVGYGNKIIIASFVLAIFLFVIFIFVEKRLNYPLLDLSLFKNSLFSVSILCTWILDFTVRNH